MTREPIFSGEPLPIAPPEQTPDVTAFNRKLLDYLRRLAARLDRFIDAGPSLEIFSASLSGNHTITGTEEGIEWTNVLRQDAVFELQADTEEIRVLEDGFYLVLCDVEVSGSANFPVNLGTWIYEAGSADFQVDFGHGYLGEQGTLSVAVPIPLEKGFGIGIYLDQASGSGAHVLATGTRITIVRLYDDFTGGTSKNPGSGWDPTTSGGGISTSDTPA